MDTLLRPAWLACLGDYVSLTRPRVLSLLLLTMLAAMCLADEALPSFGLVAWTMVGGYLAAGGAAAINCAFDCEIDRQMERTCHRAVAEGRVAVRHAFALGTGLCALAVLVLATQTTPLAALLALAGAFSYALIYTRWLKRWKGPNVVPGGAAGAFPPLVGWAAVTGRLEWPALLLAAIIFYWSPTHFWALALLRREEYARARLPMLPVVAGALVTRRYIALYALLLVVLSLLLPLLPGVVGWFYLVVALLSGAVFLVGAWRVWRCGKRGHIQLFYGYSLVYLALLFCAMVVDRLLPWHAMGGGA